MLFSVREMMKLSVLSKSGKQENYTKLAETGSLLGHMISAIVELILLVLGLFYQSYCHLGFV